MKNKKLHHAKRSKNDEFYTQWEDIEKEVSNYYSYNNDVFRDKTILCPCDDPEWSNFTKYFAQNFTKFGLKELISTSYAAESKNYKHNYLPTLFESDNPKYDKSKTKIKGKIFRLHRDYNKDGKIDIRDLEWNDYLEGDGDFRSEEVSQLRDEADVIITNPPFSLFREFLAWIMEAKKEFLIIGHMNAITYKEVFPLLKDNKIWLGHSITSGDREFLVPDDIFEKKGNYRIDEKTGKKYARVMGVRWLTNVLHNKRNQDLILMSKDDNIRYNKAEYLKYDNYEAINIDKVKCIPNDYKGAMGVPISFMDKYNPEQFEILAKTNSKEHAGIYLKGNHPTAMINGKNLYHRIIIRNKKL